MQAKGGLMYDVLVVWQEGTCHTVGLKVSKSDLDLLRSFHGQYVNGVASQNIQREIMDYFFDPKWIFKFEKSNEILKGHFDAVIMTGVI
jgi:hypothetical protein